MKNWEQEQKKKTHDSKIKRAKPTIKQPILHFNKGHQLDKKQNIIQQLSYIQKGFSYAIPIYRLLKFFGLQQYCKQFINRGYGTKVFKLFFFHRLLQIESIDQFLDQFMAIPGHKLKMKELLKYIERQNESGCFDFMHVQNNQIPFKPKCGTSEQNNFTRIFSQKENNKCRLPIINHKLNQFKQNTKKQEENIQKKIKKINSSQEKKNRIIFNNSQKIKTEKAYFNKNNSKLNFKKTQKHFNQFQITPFQKNIKPQNKQEFKNVVQEALEINQILSQIQTINKKYNEKKKKIQHTYYNNKKTYKQCSKEKNQKDHLIRTGPQQIDFKKGYLKEKSIEKQIKSFQKKQSFIPIQKKNEKKNFNNLNPSKKKIQNSFKKQKQTCKNETNASINHLCKRMKLSPNKDQFDLQIQKAKNLNMSFEGAKLTSTIINIDIEELSYCMACVLNQWIKEIPRENKDMIPDIYLPKQRQSQQTIILQNISYTREKIQQIFRQSYQYLQQEQNNQFDQSSFLQTQSVKFGLNNCLQIFNQKNSTIDQIKPSIQNLANYIKNIMQSAKMQRQIPIMAMIYIKMFLENTKHSFNPINHKRQKIITRIIMIALLIASKTWDDQSFQTNSFSQAFPIYTTVLLNQIQKVFLQKIDYKLKIQNRDYALMYFMMREYINNNMKSYHLKKLELNKVLKLQKGLKVVNKSSYLKKRKSF